MYAVVQTGGKQYRVAAGQTLEVERLDIEAGQPVVFEDVRMLNLDGQVTVGTPRVSGASVVADVVSHKRGPKIVIYKMKRRKGFRRKAGHRQELTVVKVKEINA
ncbi:MAG: 50S ribosomal protein L21 [Verrucomicrobiales bacterium]|nr:50S ribosomal protein L21 [Verrucomicrobiales bacterium]